MPGYHTINSIVLPRLGKTIGVYVSPDEFDALDIKHPLLASNIPQSTKDKVPFLHPHDVLFGRLMYPNYRNYPRKALAAAHKERTKIINRLNAHLFSNTIDPHVRKARDAQIKRDRRQLIEARQTHPLVCLPRWAESLFRHSGRTYLLSCVPQHIGRITYPPGVPLLTLEHTPRYWRNDEAANRAAKKHHKKGTAAVVVMRDSVIKRNYVTKFGCVDLNFRHPRLNSEGETHLHLEDMADKARKQHAGFNTADPHEYQFHVENTPVAGHHGVM